MHYTWKMENCYFNSTLVLYNSTNYFGVCIHMFLRKIGVYCMNHANLETKEGIKSCTLCILWLKWNNTVR
jgi:hypothetical protein